ncbi:MAG: hypothetical protein LBU77_04480 [Clostridiales bacterium]|jgi:hypothetical protein|nr:hypothetical protein [Clostridiales bacterium]
MNMQKVRSLIILFLLALNLVLLAFNWERDNRYKITAEQESAIVEVLKQNNIMLYTYMVDEFYPLSQIEMQSSTNDPDEMSSIFFDTPPVWESDPNDDKTVMTQDGKRLTIYLQDRNGFLFENADGTGHITLNKASAENACQELLERINTPALNLKLDKVIPNEEEGYYTVEYRTNFEEHVIYSSVARFRVTEEGVVQLRCVFFEPDRYTEDIREIRSADEALYALSQELKSVYPSADAIKIDQMDVVFGIEDTVVDAKTVVDAEPFYRIYISDRPEQPFLINAYTNIVLK